MFLLVLRCQLSDGLSFITLEICMSGKQKWLLTF